LAGIVHKYVTPACQCHLEFASPTGSEQIHPVIIVPGNHRTPLFAARGGPDNELEAAKVYVRRPGGFSEPARTQDDWEKLIERIVKARQTEMLSAFREILDPSSRIIESDTSTIEDWHIENYGLWNEIVEEFDDDDPRKLQSGHWSVSFSLTPFSAETLAALNSALDREMPKRSGWPPFTYLHRPPVKPVAQGDKIFAYLGEMEDNERPEDRADHCDFWRISRDGKGFMLRPMQEDRAGYPGEIYPRPIGPFFDWTISIYRITEIFLYMKALAERFSEPDGTFQLLINFQNTNGRKLEHSDRRYTLNTGQMCHANFLESGIEGHISDIDPNLVELVWSALAPIYEQFDFQELPKVLVANIVESVLNYPR
jgi:hypothetical protein